MIRTTRTGEKLKVEYQGLTTELLGDYSAILKGLLADDDMKTPVLALTLKILTDHQATIEEQIDEILKEKGDK